MNKIGVASCKGVLLGLGFSEAFNIQLFTKTAFGCFCSIVTIPELILITIYGYCYDARNAILIFIVTAHSCYLVVI